MRLLPTLAGQRVVPHSGFGNARCDKIDVRITGIKALLEALRNCGPGRNFMMRTAMTERVAVGAIAVATIFAVLSASAAAQEKVSTHGFAKKQGLKIEISQFKDDQLALKALIAGELDSFEGGPQGVFAADSKGGDVKLLGCHWVVVPHGI